VIEIAAEMGPLRRLKTSDNPSSSMGVAALRRLTSANTFLIQSSMDGGTQKTAKAYRALSRDSSILNVRIANPLKPFDFPRLALAYPGLHYRALKRCKSATTTRIA
jgi:hypothetical protein